MAEMREEDLVSLDHDDFAVAEGEPDVRGWDVVTTDQRTIGTVDDLLADPAALKVRYLTIDLDQDIAGDERDRTIRVPIARARLDEHDRQILLDVPASTVASLRSASSFEPAAGRESASRPAAEEEARMTRAAEELRIGKRTVQAGEVDVTRRVETERVQEPVTLRGERVDVERRPVSGRTASEDAELTAEEIRVPVMEEEAVVEKRPVVKEEVVITKHPTETRETIETDVRKEEIDVERHGATRGSDRDRGRSR